MKYDLTRAEIRAACRRQAPLEYRRIMVRYPGRSNAWLAIREMLRVLQSIRRAPADQGRLF